MRLRLAVRERGDAGGPEVYVAESYDDELVWPVLSSLARALGVPADRRGAQDAALAEDARRAGVRLWSFPGTGCDDGLHLLSDRCGRPEARVSAFLLLDDGELLGPIVAVRVCARCALHRSPGSPPGSPARGRQWVPAVLTEDLLKILRAREVLTG